MHVYPRVARPSLAVLTATAFALSACGGGGGGGKAAATASPTSTPTTSTHSIAVTVLRLKADTSQLKFDKSALMAKAGEVTIGMTNPSALQHNVAITGNGAT